MKLLLAFSILALSVSLYAVQSASAQKANTTETQNLIINASAVTPSAIDNLIVAELFTSQGCSSCPAAESFFSTLADRDDLLTLEWHVDYWDDLVHGGSRWKDPYSKPDFTARQRSYNRSLRGTNGVYTPQAIINGQFEGVGSRKNVVHDLIDNVSAQSIPVKISNKKVVIGPSSDVVDVLFLRLLERHETDVKAGENKGRKLSGRNIVLEASVIGTSGDSPVEFTLPSIGKGESCAVIVQQQGGDLKPVLGAAKC